MEYKYLRNDLTIEGVQRRIDSLGHNLINTNKMLGDICTRLMNLEGFMSFVENKFDELSKKD